MLPRRRRIRRYSHLHLYRQLPGRVNQLLGTIAIGATGAGGPYTNCADLGQPDSNPSNNQACVTVQSAQLGSLVVNKVVVPHVYGTQFPNLNYPVNVTCGGTTTT